MVDDRSATSASALSRSIGEFTLAPQFRGPTFAWLIGARWGVPLAALGVGYALALQGHPGFLFLSGILSAVTMAGCEFSLQRRRKALRSAARALCQYANSRVGPDHELTSRAEQAALTAKTIEDSATATQLEEGLLYTWELLHEHRPAIAGVPPTI